MARVPYLEREDLPADRRYLFDPSNPFSDGSSSGETPGGDDTEANADAPWDEPQHTHRAIANNPALLEAYRRFGASVWTETGLTERERELSILAVANALGSEYEWYQHVNVARRLGIPREAIMAVATEEYDVLSDAETALVEYHRAVVDRSVDDEDHAALAAHFDDSTIIGAGMLAAYYIGIDYMGEALALELEDEFVGWELENV